MYQASTNLLKLLMSLPISVVLILPSCRLHPKHWLMSRVVLLFLMKGRSRYVSSSSSNLYPRCLAFYYASYTQCVVSWIIY